MRILINLYNQIGAGPKNISLNLIAEIINSAKRHQKYFIIVPNVAEYRFINSTDNVNIVKLPKFDSLFLKISYRIYLDFIIIPKIVLRNKIKRMLAFGNYLISPLGIKKTVLLHHPYLFDDELLQKLPWRSRWVELFKRLVFWITLENVDTVVVQSGHVMCQFKKKWHSYKGNVLLIENPISKSFPKLLTDEIDRKIAARIKTITAEILILFVSRFYPHKNHEFLIALSEELNRRDVNHRILITIDTSISDTGEFLENVKSKKLPIFNIGEILQKELNPYYASSHVFLFPSRSETFGNPLIEAMSYGLPIVVPSLDYAHSVVDESGIYYQEDNPVDCAEKILRLTQDIAVYKHKSIESYKKFGVYPDVKTWVKKLL